MLVKHFSSGHSPALGLLWLQDRIGLRVTLTLWSVWALSGPKLVNTDHLQSVRAEQQIKFTKQDVPALSWRGIISAHSGADPIVAPLVRSSWEQLTQLQPNELFIPLQLPDGADGGLPRHITSLGLIQLLLPDPSNTEVDPAEVAALGTIIATALQLERQRRPLRALEQFQRAITSHTDPQEVCRIAAHVMVEYASATRCIIYTQTRNRTLQKYADTSENSLNEPLPEDSAAHKIFHLPLHAGRQNLVRFLNLHDKYEILRTLGDGTTLLNQELEGYDNNKSLSALYFQITAPALAGDNVPLLLLKLLVQPRSDFLGGAFSYTDELLVRRVVPFLGRLLPSLILQERFIHAHSQTAQKDPPLFVKEDSIEDNYRQFAEDAYASIPAVESSWAAQRSRLEPNAKTVWIPRIPQGPPPPAELDRFWQDLSRDRIIIPIGERRYLVEPVLNDPEQSLALVVETGNAPIALHDDISLRFIASEMRLRAIGRLDVFEMARQVGEFRHSIRASMTGVQGHLATIMETYEAAKDLPIEEVGTFIVKESKFSESIDDVALCLKQMQQLFDDSRIVHLELERSQLKLSRHKISDLVHELSRVFKPDLNRRKLRLSILDEYPGAIICPLVDKALIQLAIGNILDNAIIYSHPDTEIRIRIGVRRDRWTLSVSNVGPRHIPPAEMRRIFQARARIRTPGDTGLPGTGLGLTAALRIVRLHDPDGNIDGISRQHPRPSRDKAFTAQTQFTIVMRRDLPGV